MKTYTCGWHDCRATIQAKNIKEARSKGWSIKTLGGLLECPKCKPRKDSCMTYEGYYGKKDGGW